MAQIGKKSTVVIKTGRFENTGSAIIISSFSFALLMMTAESVLLKRLVSRTTVAFPP